MSVMLDLYRTRLKLARDRGCSGNASVLTLDEGEELLRIIADRDREIVRLQAAVDRGQERVAVLRGLMGRVAAALRAALAILAEDVDR